LRIDQIWIPNLELLISTREIRPGVSPTGKETQEMEERMGILMKIYTHLGSSQPGIPSIICH
jgi:hypothetical protein